jgi:NADH-quinone oxidoreductase subunit J
MTLPALLFFVFAGLAVLGAILLIAAREPIHSALSLILVMVSLAALYLLLGAPFIAAVQIIVYAGAIMVLFVFVIMLLNARKEERTNVSRIALYVGMPFAAFLIFHLSYWIVRGSRGMELASAATAAPADTRALSLFLFRSYLFPFEVTSILILIAILGAVVLAKKEPQG